MCGIVGIAGTRDVAPVILEALKRLEYRGYDSAGIATLQEGEICRRRSPGKLNKLGVVLENKPLGGHTGIGHTRWATHGAPTENNAHPHATGRVAIVHNGIIENFRELKAELEAKGHKFESETDSEVAAHLVTELLSQGLSPDDAAKQAVARLTGAYSIAMIFKDHEGLLIGARKGAPLAVGHGEAEAYIGSDAFALAPFTNRVTYLEDGDVVVIRGPNVSIFDEQGRPANRELKITTASAALVDKAGHNHFMAKEIHEQPEVVGHTLAHYLDPAGPVVRKLGVGLRPALAKASRLTISACGTSFYAGMVGKYWFEKLARLAVEIDVSSELRYRDPVWPEHGAALFISQSGETADTLAALRDAKVNGQTTIAVVNVSESSIAREADIVLPTYAGPEIGVASTKAFTAQVTVFTLLAMWLGQKKGVLSAARSAELARELESIPAKIESMLQLDGQIREIAKTMVSATNALFLGRGYNFPVALEGALKLKEISYIHAEGYPAAEMKHGPIALIDDQMPVVVVAPFGELYEKLVSNVQEVKARKGRIYAITGEGSDAIASVSDELIAIPTTDEALSPLLTTVPLQLLSYHVAVLRGCNVDQPRNLAKSVTVE